MDGGPSSAASPTAGEDEWKQRHVIMFDCRFLFGIYVVDGGLIMH